MLFARRTLSLVLACALAVACSAAGAACGGDDGAGGGAGSDAGQPQVDAVTPEASPPAADAAVPFALCSNGKPTVDWPPGPYEIAITSVLPPGMTFVGPSGTVALKDYFEPCAAQSRLLVVRSAAAWCGPCGWHATHTTRLLGDARFTNRLLLLDLLIADEDNMPATLPAATRWAARIDVPSSVPAKLALDASYTFSKVLPAKNVLPEYVLIDTRTMKVRTVLTNPDPGTLGGYLDAELAALDGKPRVDLKAPTLHDGLLTDDQWDLLQDMKVPGVPPVDPTNEYGDVAAAAVLGQKLFADMTLSPSGTVACITCHDPTKGFGDALKTAKGVSVGDRNSPSVALAAHARWQFWDGRADTLWMQALGPFENPKEFASSRLFVVHAIADRYAADYDAIFAAKYPRPDLTALPADGKPGDAAYDALTQVQRDDITRVYVNVGKAIAAFERSLRVAPNDLDRYAGGDATAIGGGQRDALAAFFKAGCIQCHWGPRLTDDAFHVLRFPTGRQDGAADRGRADVLLGLATSEFVATTKWSDAPASAKPLLFTVVPPSMVGAFKTPPLRGVTKGAPFGHGGAYALLSDVTKHYGERGAMVPATAAAGTVEEWVPNFDANVQSTLPQILDVLTANIVP